MDCATPVPMPSLRPSSVEGWPSSCKVGSGQYGLPRHIGLPERCCLQPSGIRPPNSSRRPPERFTFSLVAPVGDDIERNACQVPVYNWSPANTNATQRSVVQTPEENPHLHSFCCKETLHARLVHHTASSSALHGTSGTTATRSSAAEGPLQRKPAAQGFARPEERVPEVHETS